MILSRLYLNNGVFSSFDYLDEVVRLVSYELHKTVMKMYALISVVLSC